MKPESTRTKCFCPGRIVLERSLSNMDRHDQNLPLSRLESGCRCPHLLLAARVLIPAAGTLMRLFGLDGLFSGLRLLLSL